MTRWVISVRIHSAVFCLIVGGLALATATEPASAQEGEARSVRIRLVDHVSGAGEVTVTPTGDYRLRDLAAESALGEGTGGVALRVWTDGTEVAVSGGAEVSQDLGAGSQERTTAKTLRIETTAPDGVLRVRVGRREWVFPGALEFTRGKRGLAVVNEAPLEQYLLGVVAAEGPASFHLEALKALAIAARSYTECNRGRHGDGCDLCDGTHCHAYAGIGRVAPRVREAVETTAGIVALYDGRPIDACYSADCGGRTQNPDDAWGPRRKPILYLRSVPDTPAEGGREYCSVNPKHTWRATLSLETLRRRLGLRSEEIREVGVAATSSSGRVRAVRVVSGLSDRMAALARRPRALASRGISAEQKWSAGLPSTEPGADRRVASADDEGDEPLPCEVAEDERPATNDQRPTTDDRRPTTDDRRPTPGARS